MKGQVNVADAGAAGFAPGDVFRADGSGGIRVMILVEREAPTFTTWTAWFTRITKGGSACFKAGGITESELSEHWELLTEARGEPQIAWAICYTKDAWPGPYKLSDYGKLYTDFDSAKDRLNRLHKLGYTDSFMVRVEKCEEMESTAKE